MLRPRAVWHLKRVWEKRIPIKGGGFMAKKKSASKEKLENAMREVFRDEPSTVIRAKVSPERKRKMKVAIAFAKARKAGAQLSKKKGD